MSGTTRFSAEAALDVLRRDILPRIRPVCATLPGGSLGLKVCGSLRRGEAEVGDIDIVFVSAVGDAVPPGEMFPQPGQWLALAAVREMVADGVLDWRKKSDGTVAAGGSVCLTVHRASGIPVDFYRATPTSFWNVVICRTGSKEHNVEMARLALAQGWAWHPTASHPGFENKTTGQRLGIESEREFYRFLRIPFREPAQR